MRMRFGGCDGLPYLLPYVGADAEDERLPARRAEGAAGRCRPPHGTFGGPVGAPRRRAAGGVGAGGRRRRGRLGRGGPGRGPQPSRTGAGRRGDGAGRPGAGHHPGRGRVCGRPIGCWPRPRPPRPSGGRRRSCGRRRPRCPSSGWCSSWPSTARPGPRLWPRWPTGWSSCSTSASGWRSSRWATPTCTARSRRWRRRCGPGGRRFRSSPSPGSWPSRIWPPGRGRGGNTNRNQ